MRTAMRPRYYCDFCRKGNGSPSHMRKHEKGCTARPDRQCGMCAVMEEEQPNLSDLIPLALAGDVKALEAAAHGCPACMLAAIRQAPWPEKTEHWSDELSGQSHDFTFKDIPNAIAEWKFKDAVKAFWESENAASYEQEMRAQRYG